MIDNVWITSGGLPVNLVARACAGERSAEEAAVRRAMELATKTAAVIMSADLAAEVAQNVGLDVLRGLGKLREPASFDHWVHRITERRVRDMYRRRTRWRREKATSDSQFLERAEAEEDGAAREALAAALSRLGRRQRVVLALYYVHDLPVEEIAEVIKSRRGTVESLLSRGRASLRTDADLRAALGYPPIMEETNARV